MPITGRLNLLVSIGLLTVLIAFSFLIPSVSTSSSQIDWQMFHGNLQHTGSTEKNVIPPLEPLWSTYVGAHIESASPAVKDGILYIGGSGCLWALDVTTGDIIWRSPRLAMNIKSTPAISEYGIYIGTWNQIYCLSKADSAIQWNFSAKYKNLSHEGFFIDSSPIVYHGVVYIGLNDGYLYAINATTGIEIWEFKTSAPIKSTPAIYNDKVYFGSGHGGDYHDNNFYCVELGQGKLIWSKALCSDTISSASIKEGIVYVGTGPYVYAMDAEDGHFVWQYKMPDGNYIESSPAVTSTTVYICGGDWSINPPHGSLYAIDRYDGSLRWSVGTDFIRVSPSVAGEVIYLGNGNYKEGGYFYAIDGNNGSILWTYPVSQSTTSIPAIVNDNVFLAIEGSVYAFRPIFPLKVSLSGTAGNNGWYVSDVQVSFFANESSSIYKAEYSLDGVNWYPYYGPFLIKTEGITLIRYRSTDNVENIRTQTIKIDKTPPTITINEPVDEKEYLLNEYILSNWSVRDTLSGIASATATVPNGEPIDTSSSGTKYFIVDATDNAGNHVTRKVTYFVQTPDLRHTLCLRVVDDKNRPLDNVAVTLWNEEVGFYASCQEVKTNKSGWLVVRMPEGTIKYVGEWKSNYNPESVCIMASKVYLDRDMVVTEYTTVYDHLLEVVSPLGKPIAGAKVYVSKIYVGITDSYGKLVIPQMPTIYHQRWTGKEWQINYSFPVQVYWKSVFNPEAVLIADTFVDGRDMIRNLFTYVFDEIPFQIVTSLGIPVVGADVSLAGISLGLTDVEGKVTAELVPSQFSQRYSPYPITVVWYGVDVTPSPDVVLIKEQKTYVLKVMKNIATLTIEVVGAQGQPLAGAQVEIKMHGRATIFSGSCDEKGKVSIQVPYGSYDVAINYKGFTNSATTTVNTLAGTILTISTNVFIEIFGQAMTFATFILWLAVLVSIVGTPSIWIARKIRSKRKFEKAKRAAEIARLKEGPAPPCPVCGTPLVWYDDTERYYCRKCVRWFSR